MLYEDITVGGLNVAISDQQFRIATSIMSYLMSNGIELAKESEMKHGESIIEFSRHLSIFDTFKNVERALLECEEDMRKTALAIAKSRGSCVRYVRVEWTCSYAEPLKNDGKFTVFIEMPVLTEALHATTP